MSPKIFTFPEIIHSNEPVPYPQAIDFMEKRVQSLIAGQEKEALWFLEHPALLTAGTSAQDSDLLNQDQLPVYSTGRGGQYTYHGPGQRLVYVMLDLRQRGQDLRLFVAQLENWIIDSLKPLGIDAFKREGRIGIWVNDPLLGEAKIAALGIRMRSWVSFHGIAINVHPQLKHFRNIVPCGIRNFGVTSIEHMGIKKAMSDLDHSLLDNFTRNFS